MQASLLPAFPGASRGEGLRAKQCSWGLPSRVWCGPFCFLVWQVWVSCQRQQLSGSSAGVRVLISELHLASASLQQASHTGRESHDRSPGWWETALLLAFVYLCRCVNGTEQLWGLSLLGLETSEKAERAGQAFPFGECGQSDASPTSCTGPREQC